MLKAMDLKKVQVDPFGSESFGFALLELVDRTSNDIRKVICVYSKQAKIAEISDLFE